MWAVGPGESRLGPQPGLLPGDCVFKNSTRDPEDGEKRANPLPAYMISCDRKCGALLIRLGDQRWQVRAGQVPFSADAAPGNARGTPTNARPPPGSFAGMRGWPPRPVCRVILAHSGKFLFTWQKSLTYMHSNKEPSSSCMVQKSWVRIEDGAGSRLRR